MASEELKFSYIYSRTLMSQKNCNFYVLFIYLVGFNNQPFSSGRSSIFLLNLLN